MERCERRANFHCFRILGRVKNHLVLVDSFSPFPNSLRTFRQELWKCGANKRGRKGQAKCIFEPLTCSGISRGARLSENRPEKCGKKKERKSLTAIIDNGWSFVRFDSDHWRQNRLFSHCRTGEKSWRWEHPRSFGIVRAVGQLATKGTARTSQP